MHLTTQPDRRVSYSQPRTTVAHSFTKTPAVQRSSSMRTMCWECVSTEPFIAGFIVLEEPIPPADDSEHLIGSKCRGSMSQNAVFLAVQYLCAILASNLWIIGPSMSRQAACIYALHPHGRIVGSGLGVSGQGWCNRALCYLQSEETVCAGGEVCEEGD